MICCTELSASELCNNL